MRREKIQNEYMFDTHVENIFINEYMISAPGDFVKVYLVALMYADLNKKIEDEKLAKILNLEVDDILRAWKYWEELGVIKKEKGEKIFVQLKEDLYGQHKEAREEKPAVDQHSLHILDNRSLKKLFEEIESILSRPLNGMETEKVIEWIDMYGATPEVIALAYRHCFERRKENVKYVGKVVEGWTGRGFATAGQVEEFLQDTDQRHYVYKRIMKALGFSRNSTEEERRIIDRWIDEYNFSMEMILDACSKTSGISNPNLNYVNSVLMNRNKEKTGKDEKGKVTRKHILDYYEFIRNKAETDAKIRKEEVYDGIPKVKELEEEIKTNYVALTRIAITGGADKQSKLESIKKKNEKYKKEIQNLLHQAGVPVDYMEVHYKCALCNDTGSLESGQQCSCWKERSAEAADWEK